jgi:hypothetical protein
VVSNLDANQTMLRADLTFDAPGNYTVQAVADSDRRSTKSVRSTTPGALSSGSIDGATGRWHLATRVLVINRQLGFAVTIKQALEQVGGYEVAPFTSPARALDHLRQHPYDAFSELTLSELPNLIWCSVCAPSLRSPSSPARAARTWPPSSTT